MAEDFYLRQAKVAPALGLHHSLWPAHGPVPTTTMGQNEELFLLRIPWPWRFPPEDR